MNQLNRSLFEEENRPIEERSANFVRATKTNRKPNIYFYAFETHSFLN